MTLAANMSPTVQRSIADRRRSREEAGDGGEPNHGSWAECANALGSMQTSVPFRATCTGREGVGVRVEGRDAKSDTHQAAADDRAGSDWLGGFANDHHRASRPSFGADCAVKCVPLAERGRAQSYDAISAEANPRPFSGYGERQPRR